MSRNRLLITRRGATLVEVAISTVLVGFVLVTAMETLSIGVRSGREGSDAVDGATLAEQLMAEILAQPYEDPDGAPAGLGIESDEPDPPADRLAFDDVDDYDGLMNVPPVTPDGAPITSATGWKRQARVHYVEAIMVGAAISNVSDDQGVKRICVEAISPSGQMTTLYAIRSRHGVAAGTIPFDATRATAVGVSIDTGAGPYTKAVALVNDPEAP
ncbi:MAG: hypothetical protein AAFV43_09530 [Planctomycetota bacterium]